MIRRTVLVSAAVLLLGGVTLGLSRLRPAAPTVDRATVWTDEVKRGPMLREMRGLGTLVPEDIRWIAAPDRFPRGSRCAASRRYREARFRHPGVK